MQLTGYCKRQVYNLKNEIENGKNIEKFKKMHQPSKFSDECHSDARISNLTKFDAAPNGLV